MISSPSRLCSNCEKLFKSTIIAEATWIGKVSTKTSKDAFISYWRLTNNIFTWTKPTHYIVQLPITASSNWPITIDERYSSSIANNTTERLNKQFQRTTSSTLEPVHDFRSSFRDVKLSWWRTTTIQNKSRCSIVTWWVALGRGITTAPGALMSCRGATICRVSVVTSLLTLEE